MSFPKELILFSVEEFKDHSLFILCAVYDGWIKCLLFDILHIMEKEKRRILLIGDSLFTDSLVQLLADVENIELIGTAVSPTFAITAVAKAVPHIIIIANASEPEFRKIAGASVVDRVHERGSVMKFTWGSFRRAKSG